MSYTSVVLDLTSYFREQAPKQVTCAECQLPATGYLNGVPYCPECRQEAYAEKIREMSLSELVRLLDGILGDKKHWECEADELYLSYDCEDATKIRRGEKLLKLHGACYIVATEHSLTFRVWANKNSLEVY